MNGDEGNNKEGEEEGRQESRLKKEDRQLLERAQAKAEDRHRRYVEDCHKETASEKGHAVGIPPEVFEENEGGQNYAAFRSAQQAFYHAITDGRTKDLEA